MKKKILFLMSDTGGGHRAAAEAIRDALYIRYGEENVDATLVDVFKLCRFPMNYMPEFYPWLVNRSKRSWAVGYKLSNTARRAAILSRTFYMNNARRLKKMFRAHPADVIVSVHSVITRPTLRALTQGFETRPPYVTVVTDLVSTHHFWYDRRTDICFVPTQAAFDKGIEAGLAPAQMQISGLPVDPRFMQRLMSKEEARQELGWDVGVPIVLMVAGGDGMGTLYETARAINAKKLNCQMAIVAGRNKPLKEKLEKSEWHQKAYIYPFVRNMPTLMAAADMIVTKAGPATLTEAAIAGLPMVISDAIPGQEDGNVKYVIENNAGAYAPKPELVADVIASWVNGGADGIAELSQNARKIANPDAVWQIADAVWYWAHQPPIVNVKRSLFSRLRRARKVSRREK